MLRVVHVSTVHTTFDQRIFHRECHSLAEAGYETHLVIHASEKYQEIDGIHIHSIGDKHERRSVVNIVGRVKNILRAACIARKIPADIYHLHDPELIFLGVWLKANTKSAVIFDCHEDNTGYLQQKAYIQPLIRQLLIKGMARTERFAARCFDAIVAADNGVAEKFSNIYHAGNVVTIHNFPRLEFFPLPDEGQTVERPYDLVYHGTIPHYHLEVAFAVAEALKKRNIKARWLFFGKCPNSEWAQKEVVTRGLEDVFVLDPTPIPHEKVASRVLQAKIGFIPLPDLPKFQHNIPTKLFEFMALGMPAVLSDLPPSRPFVGDGKCAIMVPPGDYNAYADAIQALLQDPARRMEMGREGRRRIEMKLNWEREFEKLNTLYSVIVKSEER